MKRKVFDSLMILFSLGNWCKNKRELACIVSRLKKVDPQLATAPSVRNQKIKFSKNPDRFGAGR